MRGLRSCMIWPLTISPTSSFLVMQQSGCSRNPPSWFSTSGPLHSLAPLLGALSSLIVPSLPLPTSLFNSQLKCHLSRGVSPEPFSCFRSCWPYNRVISLQIIYHLSLHQNVPSRDQRLPTATSRLSYYRSSKSSYWINDWNPYNLNFKKAMQTTTPITST